MSYSCRQTHKWSLIDAFNYIYSMFIWVGWIRAKSYLLFLTTIALAVFAHFKNNNEETQIDVYFPNEIQWDLEQYDFKINKIINKYTGF